MAYAGLPPASFTNNLTNVQLVDDISGSFNGSTQTFALTSSSTPFHAVSARSLIVVLGGIVQKPQVDYTVDGANITFTVAPVAGLTFAARNIYGLNYLNNVNDGVITPAKLSTGAPTWNTGGTVTVSGDLNVTGSFNSGTQGLFWGDNEPANFGDGNDLKIYHNSAASLIQDTGTGPLYIEGSDIYLKQYGGSTNYISMLSNGNVGIGTTNPSRKFHVNGEVLFYQQNNTSSSYEFSADHYCHVDIVGDQDAGAGGPYLNRIVTNGTDGTLEFRHDSSINAVIKSNGKVGIGITSPARSLHVAKSFGNTDIQISGAISTSGLDIVLEDFTGIGYVTARESTGQWVFKTGGSNERLRIDSNGNVGIGTTNPTTKLEVNGNIKASTNITVLNNSSFYVPFSLGDSGAGTDEKYWRFTLDRTSKSLSIGTQNDASSAAYSAIGITRTGANVENVIFYTLQNNERLRITSTGELSISGTKSGLNVSDAILKFNIVNSNGDSKKAEIKAIKTADITSELIFSTTVSHTFDERMRIGSTGNIGIGTANPGSKLQVWNGHAQINARNKANIGTTLALSTTDASNRMELLFEHAANNYWRIQSVEQSVAYRPLVLQNDGGNVGIGTTNPGTKLAIHDTSGTHITLSNSWSSGVHAISFLGGSIGSSGTVANSCAARILCTATAPGGAATGDLKFVTNSGDSFVDALYLSPTGNVGIGTDNPTYKLDVYDGVVNSSGYRVQGNYGATTSLPDIGMYSGSSSHPDGFGTLLLSSRRSAQRPIIFATSDGTNLQERVRISSTGNVGVGTANPTEKLHVYGGRLELDNALTSQTAIQFNHAGTEMGVLYRPASISTQLRMYITGAGDLMTWSSSGNVGISTDNPTAKLQVQGSSYITSKLSVGISQFTDNAGLTVSTSGAKFFNDSLWMQPAGNVLFSARGGSGSDNWIGIGGFYNVSGGSSNILLQANFGGTGTGSGHAIRSIATGIGTQDFKIQRVYAAASTSGRPTYTDVLTINNNNGVNVVNPGGTTTTFSANGITQLSQERTFEFGISESSNYPTCSVGASQYAIGSFSGNSGYYYMVIEAWCHHRGYTNGGYSEYKKWIVLVGDRISSNLVEGSGNDNHLGLWDGSSSSNNGFNGFSTSGATMYLMVNPSCGARRNGRCRVRFYTSMPFTPDGSRISSNTTVRSNQQSPFRGNGGGKPYIGNYSTTSNSANVHVSSGQLFEVTSSSRYKTNIEDLESSYADNAIDNLRPVWYRSNQENTDDPANHSYFGLIAEEVAEVEPRLVNYTHFDEDYEDVPAGTYTDENGEEQVTVERRLKADAELRPQSVQYDRLSVMLLDVIQRQKAELAALTARVAALEGGN